MGRIVATGALLEHVTLSVLEGLVTGVADVGRVEYLTRGESESWLLDRIERIAKRDDSVEASLGRLLVQWVSVARAAANQRNDVVHSAWIFRDIGILDGVNMIGGVRTKRQGPTIEAATLGPGRRLPTPLPGPIRPA